MPSYTTKIVVPFPPLADDAGDAEKAKREGLKRKYNEMHEALAVGEFDSVDVFLRKFNVGSEAEYMAILRAGLSRPCVLHKRTPAHKFVNAFNPWIGKVLDSNMDLSDTRPLRVRYVRRGLRE